MLLKISNIAFLLLIFVDFLSTAGLFIHTLGKLAIAFIFLIFNY